MSQLWNKQILHDLHVDLWNEAEQFVEFEIEI